MSSYLKLMLLGIFITTCLSIQSVFAQSSQVIHLNNQVYTHIKNLQLRGHFTNLNPTSLPYTRGEINNGLNQIEAGSLSSTEKFWYQQVMDEVGYKETNPDEIYLYGMIGGGFDLNNTLEGDGLRPQAQKLFFLPNGEGNLYGEKNGFAAQLGLRHDMFYVQDRRGEDALSRQYVRSEDYFIGYQNDFLGIYAGRYDNNWAPYGETSTLITPNARSFDRLDITVGNTWFEVSGIFAELDNLGKDGTFNRGGKNLIDGTKRYLAIHRFDLKVTNGFRLGFFDGFIYSSQNSVPTLKYMTPMNVFFFDRNVNPVNDEFNALFGGMIWWQYQNLTMNFQLMIDDIVIRSGELRNDIEPATFAITNSLTYAGLTDNLDIGYEAEIVSYQTYNTDQAEGRYLFLRRGIATQFTDYAYVSAFANIHAHNLIRGLTLSPGFSYLAQGEQEINQDFVREYENGETIDFVLTGTEEKTSRISLDLLYNPIPDFWIDASIGYNYLTDHNHNPGATDSRFTARLEAGFRVNLDNNGIDFFNLFKRNP